MNEPLPELNATVETPEERALREWFAEQRIKSMENVEAGATHLITLILALLTVLIGIMGLSDGSIPSYMNDWEGLQWLSGIGVVALLVALVCALCVVWPFAYAARPNAPEEIKAAFEAVLARKVWFGQRAMVCFGVGVVCLGAAVVIALLVAI